ncbi:MAG: hypothetical protein VW683_01525 [Betaproteobacteria bacterium]|jgi:hypothetical protein
MAIQLLCTFIQKDELENILDEIADNYNDLVDRVYVLSNKDDANQLILTYNVDKSTQVTPVSSTISVHRKKYTNTIYTINALNQLIMDENDGVLNKSYQINWEELKNTVVVTAFGKLKIIRTEVYDIVTL